MPNLNEYYADIRTFLTYQFNEHWACRAGYIFEAFGMTKAYQTLYLQGVTAAGSAGRQSAVQYPGRVLHERHGACGAGICTVQVLA